jgi:hypothetical protein
MVARGRLEGVKLQRGAKVADAGYGHGVSTVVMAQAYESDRATRLGGPRPQRTEEKP